VNSNAEFDEIYDKYKSDVFRFAYYLTQDRGEAEDMFQEVWLRVIRYLPRREIRQDLKPWLLTVVLNLHRDLLRKKRVRRMFFLDRTKHDIVAASLTEKSAVSLSDPAERAERAARLRNINQAIARLPESQRRVFVLKEIEGLQQTEIAGLLGIPVGTVKSLMHRAVKKLQRELAASNPKGEKLRCAAKILSV
jgi:RNA polymerase sigma-70 factor (ECF subfamily)